MVDEIELNTLRYERLNKCFSIINRGKLWYDTLTAKQLEELRDWYTKWLNVTETKIIPKKPKWLE